MPAHMDSITQLGESIGVRWWQTGAFIALALGYPSEGTSAQKRAADKAEPHSRTEPANSLAIQNGLERIASAMEAPLHDPETKVERQRAQEDLRAQQDMARWSWGAMLAAIVSTIISGGALLLIWRTLHHTRLAAQATQRMAFDTPVAIAAAVEANNAMREANEIAAQALAHAQDSTRASSRPWLVYTGIRTKRAKQGVIGGVPHKGVLGVSTQLQNIGQNPAGKVLTYHEIRVLPTTAGMPTFQGPPAAVASDIVVGPSVRFGSCEHQVTGQNYDDFFAGRAVVWSYTQITYVDPREPDSPRLTDACVRITYQGEIDGEPQLDTFSEGPQNRMT